MVNSASVLGVIRAWLQNNKLRVVWYVAVQARKHSVSCRAAVAGVDNPDILASTAQDCLQLRGVRFRLAYPLPCRLTCTKRDYKCGSCKSNSRADYEKRSRKPDEC